VITDPPAAARTMPSIERRYVQVADRLLHYRCCGSGPAIVLLHDSPRSSRLHIDTMRALGCRFRVYALDTPGYGNSAPLGLPSPTIDDFAAALGDALAALGLQQAPLYATHTSAKIALAYAASQPLPPLLVLDGLSIPTAAPDHAFIDAYMRPFTIEPSGGYLASEWTRMRDMLRWFPWFERRPGTRIAMAAPDGAWIADYVIDLFSAGPHYSDAYRAAMLYDPTAALERVAVPTLVAARADDVLYGSLDRVPLSANASLSVQRLPADRGLWLEWLERVLLDGCSSPTSAAAAEEAETATFYVDLPHGQIRLHRAGPRGGRPLLILAVPTTHHALLWQEALSESRDVLVPELPGYGESDPLPTPDAESFADVLAATLEAVGAEGVDVLALGFAAPLAAMLAMRHPRRIGMIALDGLPPRDEAARKAIAARLCPAIAPERSGGHLHRIWHMLRDGDVQWPWFDDDLAASRSLPLSTEPEALHRALTDILKQPTYYGDAARAALAVSSEIYRRLDLPVLLFEHPSDPAYAAVPSLEACLSSVRRLGRPDSISGAALILAEALDGPMHTSPAPAHRAPELEPQP
jgi:pimeloyl-ACP methyl ester carboxylesterase